MNTLVGDLRDWPATSGGCHDALSAATVERLMREAADEIEWLRNHIRFLIENNPNDDAADTVTVLDVWRKEALERFGEWPTLGVADNPF